MIRKNLNYETPPETPLTAGRPAQNLVETEEEISRLTWAVLDGQASLEDRERLAELVSAQHQQR